MNQSSKSKKITLVILIISFLFIGWFILQYQNSYTYFYVEKNYLGNEENLDEIIEIVEYFDYETHLNISDDPYHVKIMNYSDPTMIEELCLKIEVDRQTQFLSVPFINSYLKYSLKVNRSSFFNFSFWEWDEYGDFQNCEGLQIKSEILNICIDDGIVYPNIFINTSFFADSIENNTEYNIEQVILVEVSFDYSKPEFLNSNLRHFNQIVILNNNLEIIFICAYNFYHLVT
ncbi:MAG: hypothetical protein ACTSWY_15650 [Promethearchaeota archaeon]